MRLSKACLNANTDPVILAKQHPKLVINCCSLGFINTALTAGCGATKPPEEGTVAIKHLLLGDVKGSGWYLGSDAQCSPQHYNESGSHCENRGQGEWLRSPRRAGDRLAADSMLCDHDSDSRCEHRRQ